MAKTSLASQEVSNNGCQHGRHVHILLLHKVALQPGCAQHSAHQAAAWGLVKLGDALEANLAMHLCYSGPQAHLWLSAFSSSCASRKAQRRTSRVTSRNLCRGDPHACWDRTCPQL